MSGRKDKKGWKILGLVAAEVAFFLAWSTYSTLPVSEVVSPVLLLPLSVIPALTLFTKKNPFSFEFFGILITIVFPAIFPSTPLYKSFINAVYVLGFENAARYLNSLLQPQPVPALPLIVALFCFAQMVEKARVKYAGIAFAFAMLSYLIYPVTLLPLKASYLMAILAVGIAVLACALISRT